MIILPKGKFVPNEPEEKVFVVFGRTLATVEDIQSKLGVDDSQKVLESAIRVMDDFVRAFEGGGTAKMIDSTGAVLGEFSTLEELSESGSS